MITYISGAVIKPVIGEHLFCMTNFMNFPLVQPPELMPPVAQQPAFVPQLAYNVVPANVMPQLGSSVLQHGSGKSSTRAPCR